MFDRLCQLVDTRHFRSTVPVVFFNPTPAAVTEVVPLTLHLPRGPAFLFETAATRPIRQRTLEQADDLVHIDSEHRRWLTGDGQPVLAFRGDQMDYLIGRGETSAPVTRWKLLAEIGPVAPFRVAVCHVTAGIPNEEDPTLEPEEGSRLQWQQMLTQPGDPACPIGDGRGLVEVRPPVQLAELTWPDGAGPRGRLLNPTSESASTVLRCRLAEARRVRLGDEETELIGRAARVALAPGATPFEVLA